MKLSKSVQRLLDTTREIEHVYSVPFDAKFAASGHAYRGKELGIVRRLMTGNVNELVLGCVISIRTRWANFAWQRERNRCYESMWEVCVLSAAIHDWDLFNKMTDELSAQGRLRYDGGCERLLYKKLFAILRDSFSVDQHAAIKIPSNVRKDTKMLVECLDAIGTHNASRFSNSLAQLISIRRRATGLDPGDRLISLLAHGLWEVANRVDSSIVESWNTEATFPWDSSLHSFTQPIRSSEELLSTLELSPDLIEAIELKDLRPPLG